MRGINTAPDGIHIVANGKLSPTVTVFDVRKFDDLFDDKIEPRDTVVARTRLAAARAVRRACLRRCRVSASGAHSAGQVPGE